MRRGKDDEKSLGPMFPRLHVNDTEKGGPRAPPRNKMALYEQLSIPSQRFSPGALPRLSNGGNLAAVAPAPSVQANSGRNVCYPLHMPQSARRSRHGDSKSSQKDEMEKSARGKSSGDEDDFAVPVYVQSGNSQRGKEKRKAKKKTVPISPNFAAKQTRENSSCGDGLESSAHQNSIQGSSCKRKFGFDNDITGRCSARSFGDPVTSEADKVNTSSFTTSREPEAVSSKRCKDNIQTEEGHGHDYGFRCSLEDIDVGISTRLSNDYQHQGIDSSTADASGQCEDRVDVSLIVSGTVRGDNTSEASIFDSASFTEEVSPDDIVGVIGQTQFWKARKRIVNQQRMFAVQVFELHRLIKVQKLIAESPHLLGEDPYVFGKTSVESLLMNKLSTECTTKRPSSVAKEKEEVEKPGQHKQHHMEYSAENAVAKTTAASTRSAADNQQADQDSYPGNFPVEPKPSDASMGPWGYPQQGGHQWLIPVMSPSEGLIYKPFPAPGFAQPVCGGYGPYACPPTFMGNIPSPAYGFPTHHHNQGIGFPTGVPPAGHSYFPSYSMPATSLNVSTSSVEQMNKPSAPVSSGQTSQASRDNAERLQHQSSCSSIPKEKRGPVAKLKIQVSKDSEVQGSTGSSPTEQTEPPAPFSAALSAPMTDGCSQPVEAEQPMRIIKVVPHNARSARESVARIFRSIQEERKQYNSV